MNPFLSPASTGFLPSISLGLDFGLVRNRIYSAARGGKTLVMTKTFLFLFPLVAAFTLAVQTGEAQWLKYPDPGTPRTQDGKANLTAPAPRTAGGKPDFSGIWQTASPKYLDNLGADGVEISMLPWAAKLYAERQANESADRPSLHCIPHSITDFDALFVPKKLIQTPGELIMLFEAYHSFRQIFTDGRPMLKDPDPAWYGYSVGKWDGDTLVVETNGINEKTWLDDGGHPHSDALRVTERFRRRDFGHMTVAITIDDPKAYAKPWTVTLPWDLLPDTDILDWVCLNERDAAHTVSK